MKLAVIEVVDREGNTRQTVPVLEWPVTIGRAIDCDVLLDDPFVAAHHASISDTDGILSLQVGASVNGAHWRGARLASGETAVLPSSEVFQLGATRLRVRRPGDALVPERALVPEPRGGQVLLLLSMAGLVGWTLGQQWLSTDPGGRFTDYWPVLLGLVLLIVIWCGIWALASKLFRGRFEFVPHTRIAVPYFLLSGVLGLVLPVLAFMLDWAFLSRTSGYVSAAVLCVMLVEHLARIVPTRRRLVMIGMASMFVAGSAVVLTLTYQEQERFFAELYTTTLAPPSLRLAPAVEPAQFLDEARRLKSILDEHARSDRFDSDQMGPWD